MNGVYCLTFPNGKRYVGKGVSISNNGIERRWWIYKRIDTSQMGRKLANAIKYYGVENIKYEVIFLTNDNEKALMVEKHFVDVWGLTNIKYGYNHVPGGRRGKSICKSGLKHTEESKKKMSLAHKGKCYRTGYACSKETKAKISNTLTGKKLSSETKNKISLSMQGKHHTEEAKKKMSLAQKGRKVSEEERKRLRLQSIGNKNMLGKHHSDKTKEKLRLMNKGKKLSPETKLKIKISTSGLKNKNAKITTIKNITSGYIESGCLSEMSRLYNFNRRHLMERGKSKEWILISVREKE